MEDAHAKAREAKRIEGEHPRADEAVPTYQELLDEAIDETFPASDPISPTAAMSADEPVETARDGTDWALKPGCSSPPVAGGPKVVDASPGPVERGPWPFPKSH